MIDKACGVLSKVASFYVGLEEDATIDKIVVSLKSLWPETQLSKAVGETVTLLIEDDEHLLMLEKPEKYKWYSRFLEKIGQKKDELLRATAKIEKIENKDKEVMADCAFILG